MNSSFPWNPLLPFILTGFLCAFHSASAPLHAGEWLDVSGQPVPVEEETIEDTDVKSLYQEPDDSQLPGMTAFDARGEKLPGMAGSDRRGRAPAAASAGGKARVEKVWIWQETSDCLWNMAKEYYGNPYLWTKIYEANRNIIKNPHVIFPKQRIVIPPLEASVR